MSSAILYFIENNSNGSDKQYSLADKYFNTFQNRVLVFVQFLFIQRKYTPLFFYNPDMIKNFANT